MARAGCNSPHLAAIVLALASSASATFDHLDVSTATFILIGIALLYFLFTALLVLLIFYCCCKRKYRHASKNGVHKDIDESLALENKGADRPMKPFLGTIHETSFDTNSLNKSNDPKHKTPRSSLKRRKKDDESFLTECGPADQPSSPTDSNTLDMSFHPQESAYEESSHVAAPIQQTPDLRKKKLLNQKSQPMPVTADDGNSSNIPSHDYPTSAQTHSTGQRVLTPIQITPNLRKHRKTKTKEEDSEKKRQDATASDLSHRHTASDLPPIQSTPNTETSSSRMQRNVTPPLPAIPINQDTPVKVSSDTPQQSSAETQALDVELSVSSKKSEPDKSLGIMNPGFKEEKKMVTLLAFQDELKTVARYWYKIGKELQVSDDDLKNIRSIHNKNYTKCLGSVYIEWNKLQTNSTWEKLVEALRGKEVTKLTVDVANAIQKKYCPDTHSLSPSMTSGKSFTLL